MKTKAMLKKIITVIASLLLVEVSFSQQQGFFQLFEDERSLLVQTVIEANEGCYIFVQNEENFVSKCELVKLSEEGNLLKRVKIDLFPSYSYTCSDLKGIFHDPVNPDLYLGIGLNIDVPNRYARPFVIRFDEELNITFAKEVELPEQYRALESSTFKMTHDGKFMAVVDLWGQYIRLHMLISPDGVLERLHEDSLDAGLYIGTLFEYPNANCYGHYRKSWYRLPSPRTTTRLFTLDENFDTISSKEFTTVTYDSIGNNIFKFTLVPIEYTTMRIVDDTTLVFYDRVRELSYVNGSSNPNSQHEYSTLLFKTDLLGNILEYHLIGSWNGYNDMPAILGQSFDYATNCPSSQRQLYVCYESYDIDDEYYMEPNSITVAKMDEDGTIVWQNNYSIPSSLMRARCLLATQDGGCIVLGEYTKNNQYEVFALKIDSEGSYGMDEVSIRPYAFYPNPTRELLFMQFSPDVQPAQIELYDLQGRLVRTQSKAFESIDMSQLPAGTYTMRVTMEDGKAKAYSDKVVKE